MRWNSSCRRRGHSVNVGLDGQRGVVVLFHLDQFEQFARVSTRPSFRSRMPLTVLSSIERQAQGLRAFGVVPDVGAFEFAVDFFQTLDLGVVVKDTPSAHRADR